jgi:hypothetical protein
MAGLFGMRPSPADLARKEQSKLKSNLRTVTRQLEPKVKRREALNRKVDLLLKRGMAAEAERVAGEMDDLDGEIAIHRSQVKEIENIMRYGQRAQINLGRIETTRSMAVMMAGVSQLADPAVLGAMQMQIQIAKDRSDMAAEQIDDVFTPEEDAQQSRTDRINHILEQKMQSFMMEQPSVPETALTLDNLSIEMSFLPPLEHVPVAINSKTPSGPGATPSSSPSGPPTHIPPPSPNDLSLETLRRRFDAL